VTVSGDLNEKCLPGLRASIRIESIKQYEYMRSECLRRHGINVLRTKSAASDALDVDSLPTSSCPPRDSSPARQGKKGRIPADLQAPRNGVTEDS
jgi:hypothetical protein